MVKIEKEFPDYQWKDSKTQTNNILYKISKILVDFKSNGLTHLDVGCGNGRLLEALSSKLKKFNYLE